MLIDKGIYTTASLPLKPADIHLPGFNSLSGEIISFRIKGILSDARRKKTSGTWVIYTAMYV